LKEQHRNSYRYKHMVQSSHLTFEIRSSSENLKKQSYPQTTAWLPFWAGLGPLRRGSIRALSPKKTVFT
jgi:hypothetical protein